MCPLRAFLTAKVTSDLLAGGFRWRRLNVETKPFWTSGVNVTKRLPFQYAWIRKSDAPHWSWVDDAGSLTMVLCNYNVHKNNFCAVWIESNTPLKLSLVLTYWEQLMLDPTSWLGATQILNIHRAPFQNMPIQLESFLKALDIIKIQSVIKRDNDNNYSHLVET